VSDDPYEVDARFYDLWHPPNGPDVPLWLSFAARTELPTIEVGVGTGRIALALARAGHEVVGVDPSPAMLERARRKAEQDALDVELVEGRLPDVQLEQGAYGLVLFPADVFLACRDREEQRATLEAARAALRFDGVVILDLPGPALWLDPATNGQPVLVASRRLDSGELLEVWQVHEDDLAAQSRTLRVAYELTGADGHQRRFVSEHRLRYVYPVEAEYLLERSGLELTATYGDYELGPLGNESERMILVARPRG